MLNTMIILKSKCSRSSNIETNSLLYFRGAQGPTQGPTLKEVFSNMIYL